MLHLKIRHRRKDSPQQLTSIRTRNNHVGHVCLDKPVANLPNLGFPTFTTVATDLHTHRSNIQRSTRIIHLARVRRNRSTAVLGGPGAGE